MKSGIYMIMTTSNRKKYIGSSVNINRRFSEHKLELMRNKHCNSYLQNSFNKYGEENFQFSVLELCDEELLTERENHWCTIFNTHNKSNGYNLAPIVRNGKFSIEHRKAMSDNCTIKKRVWLTDKNGNILNVFESRTEAAKIMNTQLSNVIFLLNGTSRIFNKSFMLWDSIYFTKSDIAKKLTSTRIKAKKVYQFNEQRELVNTFNSLKEAVSLTGVKVINAILTGRRSNCFAEGFFWSHFEKCPDNYDSSTSIKTNRTIKPVYQYSLDKELLHTHNSIKEIENNNFKIKGIEKAMYGSRPFYKGFIWSRDIL